MDKPDILMPVPLPAHLRDGLAGGFNVVCPFEAADPDAALAEIAPGLRFIVTGVPVIAEGVSRPIDQAYMARFPKLALVANMGVGYDNIDAKAAAARGIVVTNTPDVLTEETADAAFGLLLAVVRQLPQADRFTRAGEWPKRAFPLSASLRGRTMGIVGLGRIGKAIALRGEAFGLKIAYNGRHEQKGVAWPFFADLVEMAKACDILMVSTPGGAETRNLVGAAALDALGPDGVVVNIARGGIVDEDALIAALREKRILSAGLDVYLDEPRVPEALLAMDHVVLLPHVGSATGPTRVAMAGLVIDNVASFTRGAGPLTPVAETPWPPTQNRAK